MWARKFKTEKEITKEESILSQTEKKNKRSKKDYNKKGKREHRKEGRKYNWKERKQNEVKEKTLEER